MQRIEKDSISVKDPFEYVTTSAKKALETMDDLNKSANEIAKAFKADLAFKTDSRGILEQAAAQEKLNRVYKQKVEYDKASRLTKQQMQSAEQSLQRQREKSIAQLEKEASRAREAERPYNQLSKTLNDLRKEYRDLAVSGREYTKEGRAMLAQISQMDKKLKGVDAAVGQNFRKVGDYTGALSKGFKSAIGFAGQLGVAFSGGALISGAVGEIKKLEDTTQSFRTIVSDLNDTEFAKFKGEIRTVADQTKKSNIEVAESFSTIAGLNAEFAKTAQGLGDVSAAAVTLSKASKEELQPSAENLVGIMNQFSLGASEADRTINVLAAGTAVGSASIGQTSEAFKTFGSVASGANITLEESVALVQVLGKFSITGAEAGTKLRGVTLQLQKANLGYASGQFDINDALAEYKAKVEEKKTAEEKDAYALKIFGAENITAGKIVSNNTDLFEKYTKSVTGTTEAQKAAEINSNTLTARWDELKAALSNLVTNSDAATTSLGGVKEALRFLADNLPEIISIMLKLIRVFVIYKATMAGMKLKDRAKEFLDLKKNAEGAAEGMAKGNAGAKAFGSALKGMGIAIAIELFIELASAIYDYASGAQAARFQQDQLNKAVEIGGDAVQKYLDKLKSVSDERDLENRELKKQGKITQDEYNKRVIADNDLTRATIKNTIDRLKARRDEAVQDYKQSQEVLKNRSLTEAIGFTADNAIAYAKKETDVARNLAQIKLIDTELKGLYDRYGDLGIEVREFKLGLDDETKSIAGSTNKTKEKTKSLKDANDQIQHSIDLLKEQQELTDDNAVSNAEANTEYGLASQLLIVSETGEYQIELLDELIKKEYDLKRAIIERAFAEETAGIDAGSSAYQNAESKRQQALGELEDEFATKRRDNLKELEDAQEDYAEKQSDILQAEWDKNAEIEEKAIEESKKRLEDLANFKNKLIEAAAKFESDRIDELIERENKKADAAKATQDYLTELAKAGSIEAKDSIVEQQRIQEEADRRKIDLERRKARVLAGAAILQSYNNKVAEGDKTPVLSTASDIEAVFALLGTIPKFFHGTENTGSKGFFKDQFGEVTGVTHKNERVFTADQNKKIGNISNEEAVANLAYMHNTGKLIDKGRDIAGNSFDLIPLLKKQDEMIQELRAIPEKDLSVDQIAKGVFMLTASNKVKNYKTVNKYVVKR